MDSLKKCEASVQQSDFTWVSGCGDFKKHNFLNYPLGQVPALINQQTPASVNMKTNEHREQMVSIY